MPSTRCARAPRAHTLAWARARPARTQPPRGHTHTRSAQALEEANEWLDDNQHASTAELEEKLAELKASCGPIVDEVHRRKAREPGGADDDGFDDL